MNGMGLFESDLASMETNLRAEIAKFERTMTLRIIAIVGTLHTMLFVLLKLT